MGHWTDAASRPLLHQTHFPWSAFSAHDAPTCSPRAFALYGCQPTARACATAETRPYALKHRPDLLLISRRLCQDESFGRLPPAARTSLGPFGFPGPACPATMTTLPARQVSSQERACVPTVFGPRWLAAGPLWALEILLLHSPQRVSTGRTIDGAQPPIAVCPKAWPR